MKTNLLKLLFAILFLFNQNLINAQKLSYGVILGGNIFNDQSSNGGSNDVFWDSGNDDFIVPNLGGYLEYELSKNMGLKLEITTNSKSFDKGFANRSLDQMYKLNFIDINPNFKYDFGNEYRKGFYMMLGPKFALLTKAEFDGQNVTSEFEKVNIGLELGLGQRFLKFLEIEGKFDYGLTPFYKFPGSKPNKIMGFYISLNVDIQKIVASK
ncbi:MAG: outer membrane beta-barrel protein [Bacteroidota bacterium]